MTRRTQQMYRGKHQRHHPRRAQGRGLPPGFDPYAEPGTFSRENHTPNVVPLMQRVAYACLGVALICYGAIGVLTDALWIPGRRTAGVVLSGYPTWLAMASLCAGAFGLLSVVLDHFDRRNNQHHYRRFQSVSRWLCLWCLVAAVIWHAWPLIAELGSIFGG